MPKPVYKDNDLKDVILLNRILKKVDKEINFNFNSEKSLDLNLITNKSAGFVSTI